MTIRLGVLISGGGTTFLNLHQQIQEGKLDARIACVVSSSARAAGLDRARELGYPSLSVSRKRAGDDEAFSEAINQFLVEKQVELVILAGFLKKYLPGPAFRERALNIHPSLIPAFCGHGYYGMKVHEAVWQRGCKVTGCTVHLVNQDYDEGPILVQQVVPVTDADSPEDIRARVFAAECEAYPRAIRYFAEGRITFPAGRAVIAPDPREARP